MTMHDLSPQPLEEIIRAALLTVKYPGYSRDIVSFGMFKGVATHNGSVAVTLAVNSTKPDVAFQIQADAEKVLRPLPQLQGLAVKVEMVGNPESYPQGGNGDKPPLSPLQDDSHEAGTGFDPDPMIAALARPDLAPGAGYGEDGPNPLGGPMGDRASTRWQGPVPVFQWEIDPSAPGRQQYGEYEVEREGWIFRAWWQLHPAGLVYASVSAITDEDAEGRPHARRHPIGRNVAVNLVYDLRREGVVAVYGTALDFRPFVEVFLEGFGIAKLTQSGARAPAQEKSP